MKMEISKYGKITRYAALFIWIALILFLSTGNGSSEETSRIIGPILKYLFPDASADLLEFYHAIIRKLAHPTAYGILAYLAARTFAYGRELEGRLYWCVRSLLVVIIVASIDEFNQSYLPSRTGSPRDVLLDLCGALFALGLFALWNRRSDVELRAGYNEP